jgi:hypothetical protein
MKRLGRRALQLAIAGALVTVCRPAGATDPATATMLFNEARHLVAAGRYQDACPKFEESQRLDPGIGTQFNLADCYEHTDRIASAWALFLDVASSAGGTGQLARESVARRRASALEPRLSKLTIAAPASVAGLEVRRNGEQLGSIVWNNPIPVDPGNYTIEAAAPGKKPWSTVAKVGSNGAAVTVAIPALAEGDDVAPSPPETADAADHSNGVGRPRWAAAFALGLGGAGVVGVGIGSYFGLRSIAKHSDYENLCTRGLCAPAAGPLHDQAVAAGNVSTVAFLVGGALIAGGTVLWFAAPRSGGPDVAPQARSPVSRLRIAPALGTESAGAIVAGGW